MLLRINLWAFKKIIEKYFLCLLLNVLSLINICSKHDPETTHAKIEFIASLIYNTRITSVNVGEFYMGFLLLDSVSGHFLIRS